MFSLEKNNLPSKNSNNSIKSLTWETNKKLFTNLSKSKTRRGKKGCRKNYKYPNKKYALLKTYEEIVKKRNIKNKNQAFIKKIIFGQSPEEFENFLGDSHVFFVIDALNTSQLLKLFKIENIKTKEDFVNLIENCPELAEIGEKSRSMKYRNLNKLLDFLLDNNMSLTSLSKKNYLRHLIQAHYYPYIGKYHEVYQQILDIKKHIKQAYDLNVLTTEGFSEACGENEKLNLKILLGKSKNFIPVYIGNKLIGIIKKDGEKTFLSFENVINKEGVLIFAKKFIYDIKINGQLFFGSDLINYKRINLKNFKSHITVGPVRPMNNFLQYKFDEYNTILGLKNNFDEIVKTFSKNFLTKII